MLIVVHACVHARMHQTSFHLKQKIPAHGRSSRHFSDLEDFVSSAVVLPDLSCLSIYDVYLRVRYFLAFALVTIVACVSMFGPLTFVLSAVIPRPVSLFTANAVATQDVIVSGIVVTIVADPLALGVR